MLVFFVAFFPTRKNPLHKKEYKHTKPPGWYVPPFKSQSLKHMTYCDKHQTRCSVEKQSYLIWILYAANLDRVHSCSRMLSKLRLPNAHQWRAKLTKTNRRGKKKGKDGHSDAALQTVLFLWLSHWLSTRDTLNKRTLSSHWLGSFYKKDLSSLSGGGGRL